MDAVNVACCLLAALLYYNTLDAGFVYDDSRAILTNQDVLPTTPLSQLLADDFWGTPLTHGGSHGSYRPLCVLTFRLNYLLGGFHPWGYHLANVCLHCLATALVVKLARALLPPGAGVGVAAAGALFAAHPVHAEAVAGVVGRADLAACVFYLASFLCYVAHVRMRDRGGRQQHRHECGGHQILLHHHRRRRSRIKDRLAALLDRFFEDGAGEGVGQWGAMVGCVGAASCAVFAKETGVTVLGVCACYDLLLHYGRWKGRAARELLGKRRPRRVLLSLAVLGLTLAALLAVRMRQMGAHYPVFATADNPTARCASPLTRLLTFCYLPAFNFALLLCPRWLSFDWGMDAIPRVSSLSDPRNLATLLFYGCLYRAARSSTALLGGPAGQPSGPGGGDVACRAQRGKHRRHQPQQHRRDRDRKEKASSVASPTVFGDATCPVCKHNLSNNHHSLLCRNNNNNNNIPTAEEPGATQCTCRPRDRRHGRISAAVGKRPLPVPGRHLDRAELVLLSLAFLSIPFLPATNLFFYVGFVVAERVLYIPSVGYCLLVGVGCHAIHERTNKKLVLVCLVLLLVNLSVRTLLRNRDWHDEERLYRSGIHINPPKAYGNLGSVLSSQGRTTEAEWAFQMALRYRGNMADVHYNLGVLLQGREQYEEAIKSYELAIQYRPTLALAHLNLGQLLERLRRCDEAIAVYRRCSRLDGARLKDPRTHEAAKVSALLHLGRLYADQGRLHDAAQAYQEAVHSMPEYYPSQTIFDTLGDSITGRQQREQYRLVVQSSPGYTSSAINNKSRTTAASKLYLRPKRRGSTQPTVFHHMGKVMFCYYASWAHYRVGVASLAAADLDPSLCSHLVYAFAGVSSDGVIESLDAYNDLADNYGKGSYKKFTALAQKHPNVTTLLAIGGWNHGSTAFSKMAATDESRERFADSVVVYLKKYGFQGLDVDWEYPTQRGGMPEDKANYVLLLQVLQKKLHAENLLLTTAVGAATSLVGTAYDVQGVAQSVDYISVMTFDYHTPSSDNVTGINSPLSALPSDVGNHTTLNIKASIAAWVDGGAPKSKLLVGFPLYGHTFTLTSADDNGVGAPVSGTGRAGPYTKQAGYLGYYEICRKLKTEANWTKVYNNSTASLYVYKDDQWISFDDETTFMIKANYVLEEELAGVMIWPIDTDDFIGTCSNRKNPLQKVIKEIIGS